MSAEGYGVHLAKSSEEVLGYIHRHEPIDLIILDLDLPDAGELAILERLQKSTPTLPVIVHAFLSDYANHPAVLSTTAFVEKNGSSIDSLKKTVLQILGKSCPRRTACESTADAIHQDKKIG